MSYKKIKIEKKSQFYIVLKWLVDLVVVIGAAIFIGVFFGEQYTATGYSMEPTLTNEDKILVDKLRYHFTKPERGDIIVFYPKSDATQYYIKRVVALPGEKVQIIDGVLYIDGKAQDMEDKILNAGLAGEEILLSDGEYFVLGDNWNNSEDSRFNSIGNVKHSSIVGRVWLEVTTLNDIAFVK